MDENGQRPGLAARLDAYSISHPQLIKNDSEFSRWLEEEYVPIAGGWMY